MIPTTEIIHPLESVVFPDSAFDADLRTKQVASLGLHIHAGKLAVDTSSGRYGRVVGEPADGAVTLREAGMNGETWTAQLGDCINLGWNWQAAAMWAAAWVVPTTDQ